MSCTYATLCFSATYVCVEPTYRLHASFPNAIIAQQAKAEPAAALSGQAATARPFGVLQGGRSEDTAEQQADQGRRRYNICDRKLLTSASSAGTLFLMTGERLRSLRHRLCLSQEGLARLLGVSFASVNRWETIPGVSGPHGTVLLVLFALEQAVEVEPCLGERIVEWWPRGQSYVLHQVLALAHGGQGKARGIRR